LDFLTLTKSECKVSEEKWDNFGAHYMLGNKLEITPSSLLRSEGRQRHHYLKLRYPNDNDSASECVAKAKADPNFRIPCRLGSPTKRRVFERALTEMAAAMKEIRQSRDKLKGKLKVRRSLLQEFEKDVETS
jgi:hypothetical protein